MLLCVNSIDVSEGTAYRLVNCDNSNLLRLLMFVFSVSCMVFVEREIYFCSGSYAAYLPPFVLVALSGSLERES